MRIHFLLTSLMIMTGCARVDTNSYVTSQHRIPSPSPSVQTLSETTLLLKPVSTNVRLTSKQKKYLDESLPSDVREILEKSEKFEVLAEVNTGQASEEDLRSFHPNRIVTIENDNQKKEILEAFYRDAASEDGPAACYEPHHSIRAIYAGKTVEIEICFDCAQFVVKNSPQDVWGTIVRDGRKSQSLLTRILENQGHDLDK